jgi:glycosyltransferase involved in cell wall biosynthesis
VLPRFWPRPAVFKSNQAPGAGVMVAAARAAGAPCIVRAGYLPSNIAAWTHGPASPQARRLAREERRAFAAADLAVVTTREMAGQLARNYGVDPGRVRVVPNYVDTELFRPDPAAEPEPGRVVSVGRLHPEKNLAALVEAAAGLPVVLELIGSGPQARELAGLARRLGVELELPGPVPHAKLPARLARAQVFAFPSTGEHHPKSLLEAMSAGKAVVACRVPGVRELVDHGRTGWLTGTGPAELRQGLEAVLGQAGLRAGLGRRAREFCLERFALARVVDQELAVLAEAAA